MKKIDKVEKYNQKTNLVIMAAGMGSRFGGLKQIEPVGQDGKILLDYSVYDATKAGFDKVVFIIRRDMEKDFREIVKTRIEKMIDVDFVFQNMENIPNGFHVPEGRPKPWGTGHAMLCAAQKVDTPFALINADDYYGQSSYKLLHDQLTNYEEMCMVGFRLGNTLTENGTVARGICKEKDGYLMNITEHTALDKNSGISLDTVVSMNMWGLMPQIFDFAKNDFEDFIMSMNNPLKDEFYIPSVIDNMISKSGGKVRVLRTSEKWYGMTYKEDKDTLVTAIKDFVLGGHYNGI